VAAIKILSRFNLSGDQSSGEIQICCDKKTQSGFHFNNIEKKHWVLLILLK
jgi:hypothetical protein